MADITKLAKTLSPKKQELLNLLLKEKEKGIKRFPDKTSSAQIPRRSKFSPSPLSFAQQRLWFIDQLTPGSPAFNIPAAIRLSGELNMKVLKRSFSEIVKRHETLRTTFIANEGTPMQVIAPYAEYDIPIVDLKDLSEERQMKEIQRLVTSDCQRPFELSNCPLMRSRILLLEDNIQVMVLIMHHIIGDVWSIRVVMRELATLYETFLSEKQHTLPDLPIQYADYAIWQRGPSQGNVMQSQLSYWKEKLSGMPEELELPIDRLRPAIQSVWGAKHFINLSQGSVTALRNLGRVEKVSLFMSFLAVWKLVLHHYTGQTDIVVGAPVANRNRSEFEGMIGFFVNSIILRTELKDNPKFRELIQLVRETTLGAFSNQDVPFERLVEALQPTRSMSRNPLFQTDFILQNSPRSTYQVSGMSFEALPVENGTAQLDLTLDLWEESDGGVGGWFEYDTDLFDKDTIARMADHFKHVLDCVITDPDRRLSQYSLLSAVELNEILNKWGDTARPYQLEKVYTELFEDQVDVMPDRIAAVYENEHISYSQLNWQANNLARLLIRQGINHESIVVLLARRNIQFLTTVLAILKSGGGYLPLDPLHPPQRHRNIIEQSNAQLLIASAEFVSNFELYENESGSRIIEMLALDEPIEPEIVEIENVQARSMPDSPAYVIYTSGSTGIPKGVLIHQRGMVNHFWANIEALGMDQEDIFAQTATQCFDISVWQFLGLLIIGGRVEIFPEDIAQHPIRLLKEIDRAGVTIFETVPSLLQAALTDLNEYNDIPIGLKALKWALPTGEEVPVVLCQNWFKEYPTIPLINAYGPTECSDDVTMDMIFQKPAENMHRMPIGKPIGNVTVAILDRELKPVPVGVAGELYVRGVGVGRGYLGLPERTAMYFMPDLLTRESGRRMYRTGDRVRCLPDGRIEFLGRVDHQVKVRGFRIELGEIETVLRKAPGVKDALVIVKENIEGDRRLIAYVTSHQKQELVISEVRSYVQQQLPEYMIPSYFVVMESFPLTPNGKLDRKALPNPEIVSTDPDNILKPRTPTEEVLSVMWAGILGKDHIGVEDNLFEHGAHSLLITQVLSRIRKSFGVEPALRLFFECPTTRGLASAIDRLRGEGKGLTYLPITPIKRTGQLPLSFTQERMWFLDQLEPELTAYNVPGAVFLDGPVIVSALEEGIGEIIRRHEIFRTTYGSENGKPVQIIGAPQSYQLPIVDLTGLLGEKYEEVATRLAQENAGRPFHLSQGPVLRCFLVRIGPSKQMLSMTTHHIAYDMWSRDIFIFELGTLYQAFIGGEQSPLPDPEIQWVDYASWQREWLQGEILSKQLDYWRKKLSGVPAHLDMPIDFTRPPVQSYRGARQYLQMPQELAQGISSLSKKRGVTRFIVVLTAFKVLLHRYTGEDQIVIGSPIANRTRQEVEKLMGFLANTLVLYTDLSGNPTFVELIDRVRETVLEAHDHQDLPFESLVQALQPQRHLSRPPIFQLMFNYMLNYSIPRVDVADLSLRLERLHSGAAQFEINFDIWETGDGLSGVVEYCTDLFHHQTITNLIVQFKTLLEEAIADPGKKIHDYQLLPHAEQLLLLNEWNAPTTDYRQEKCIHDLFEEQVRLRPDSIAIVFESEQITYRELNRRSDCLAGFLQKSGVNADATVGLYLERSLDMIISILGVLKAGGAYVPIDTKYPSERVLFMIEDAGIAVLLTQEHLRANVQIEETSTYSIDNEWGKIEREESSRNLSTLYADSLAYVIYTSGSTGNPKGVAISHRNVCRLFDSSQSLFAFNEQDVWTFFHSYAFDFSVWELWGPLINGGRLVLIPYWISRSPDSFYDLINREQVTVLNQTPSAFHQLSQIDERTMSIAESTLRLIIFGGEMLEFHSLKSWIKRHGNNNPRLINMYGITETTVHVTFRQIDVTDIEGTKGSMIGQSLPDLGIDILDQRGELVPIGVSGEIYVRGAGVARGYLNNSEQTADRFIPDIYSRSLGSRLYRTGDLARYRHNGEVEYLGRIDHQTKIRGFRIELGEIETHLNQHASVQESIVIVREDPLGEKRLVAYITSPPGEVFTVAELRQFLQRKLPDYMVPATFIILDSLPLTPNGKIDRKALPISSEDNRVGDGTPYIEPTTDMQRMIAHIWSELLGIEKISIHDNFFDLGGHSLLAVQFLSRLRDRLQIELPLKTLFESPILIDVAETITAVCSATQALKSQVISVTVPLESELLEEGIL